MPFDLVALGNPLLDIQVNVSSQYLAKYELQENDAILADEKTIAIFKELITLPGVKFIAGGSAQNAARAAQYMMAPKSVIYLGCVGEDEYSAELRKANDVAGIESHYLVDKDVPTGKCAVMIHGHNRSMVTDLGAANHYKLEHLQAPETWQLVQDAKVYYTGGFHLTVCPAAMDVLGAHAAKTNKIYATNISAPFLAQLYKAPMDANSVYWDYVIGNEAEALAWAENHGVHTKEIKEIAKQIALMPKTNSKRERTVIITQGTDPTLVAVSNLSDQTASVSEHKVHVLPPESIHDTNGAGDAFAGGFLSGLVANKSLEQCIERGHWLAAVSLKELGPSFPYPPQPYDERA